MAEKKIESKPLLLSESTTPATNRPSPSIKGYVAYVVNISITTFVLLVTFIINGFAASGSSKFGFENSTGNVSDKYQSKILQIC